VKSQVWMGLSPVGAQSFVGFDVITCQIHHHLHSFLLVLLVEPCSNRACDHRNSDMARDLSCLQDREY
jgi:hypothetical protein